MKIFIFTYDRFNEITTSRYFAQHDHFVLCHSKQAKDKFLQSGNIFGEIIATEKTKGLSYNRNAALDMMQPNEWALFFVDDLIKLTMLQSYYKQPTNELDIDFDNVPKYREEFKTECSAASFLQLCQETILHAEKKGFNLCGFSLTDNPLFRAKKYGYWSLSDGRCWLIKKTHLRFDENIQLIDDTCFTAMNLKEFGGVVNNNWILPNCQRYTAGAFGSIKKRLEQKIKECKYLTEKYPQFISYAEKSGWPLGSHIKIRQNRTYNKNQKTLF